jgi:hypothetical protein
MIKVVFLTQVTITEAGVDLFVAMMVWVKTILLLASA